MLLKPHRIPSFVCYHLYFFIYLTQYRCKKNFLNRETNTSFLESYWSLINMIKRIWTCIGVPKKKRKVLLQDFVPRPGSFFSPVLVKHWLHILLLLYVLVLAKVPKTRLHIRETRQRPIFSIQITKHYKNLDSILFISEVVVHHTAITLKSHTWKQCKSNQLVSAIYI